MGNLLQLTLQTNTTQKRFSEGDIREDGYIFRAYLKRKLVSGEVVANEQWLSPESYHRYRMTHALTSARKRAADQNLPFDIDVNHLLSIYPKDNKCPIFGIELSWGDKSGRETSPSLDKIHPALGYVVGNVVWISNYANRLKSDHSLDTLRTLLAFYEKLERRNE